MIACIYAMSDRGVIGIALTCQASFSDAERQGDSQRAIDNPLTCQGALCNRSERQAGSWHAVATDLVHRSSTTVQNRELCKENLKSTYATLSRTHKNLAKSINELLLNNENLSNTYENSCCSGEVEVDLGIKRNVIETSKHDNRKKIETRRTNERAHILHKWNGNQCTINTATEMLALWCKISEIFCPSRRKCMQILVIL